MAAVRLLFFGFSHFKVLFQPSESFFLYKWWSVLSNLKNMCGTYFLFVCWTSRWLPKLEILVFWRSQMNYISIWDRLVLINVNKYWETHNMSVLWKILSEKLKMAVKNRWFCWFFPLKSASQASESLLLPQTSIRTEPSTRHIHTFPKNSRWRPKLPVFGSFYHF